QIRALADEARVVLDLQHRDHIAARSAARARVALAAQRDVVAGRDAGRDLDDQLALLALDTFAPARTAHLNDAMAVAPARRARRHAHQLAEDRALDATDLARAAARQAPVRRRAALRARAAARVARVEQPDPQRLARTGRDFLQRQRHLDLRVRAPALARTLPPRAAAEQVVQPECAEIAHEDVQRLGEIEAAEARARGAGPADARMAVTVVRGTLLRVAQDLVRLRRLLELLLGFLRTGVPVRVVLERQLAVRPLDRVRIGAAIHAQDLVVVPHSSSKRRRRMLPTDHPPNLPAPDPEPMAPGRPHSVPDAGSDGPGVGSLRNSVRIALAVSTIATTRAYGIRVGPITPMTPVSSPTRYSEVISVNELSCGWSCSVPIVISSAASWVREPRTPA